MDGRRAWRQWWLSATITAIALITIIASIAVDAPWLEWWVLAPTGVGLVAVIVGGVVNRPRPFTAARGPGTRGTELNAACKAIRRGRHVEPPSLRLDAVDVVRREWYSISLSAGFWPLLALNWTQQILASDFPGLFSTVLATFGGVLLLAGAAAIGYYRPVLRRIDSLDEGAEQ